MFSCIFCKHLAYISSVSLYCPWPSSSFRSCKSGTISNAYAHIRCRAYHCLDSPSPLSAVCRNLSIIFAGIGPRTRPYGACEASHRLHRSRPLTGFRLHCNPPRPRFHMSARHRPGSISSGWKANASSASAMASCSLFAARAPRPLPATTPRSPSSSLDVSRPRIRGLPSSCASSLDVSKPRIRKAPGPLGPPDTSSPLSSSLDVSKPRIRVAPEPLGPPCTSPPLSSSLDVSKPRIRVAPEARGPPITPALSPTAALSAHSPSASNTVTSVCSPDAVPPGHAPAPASSTASASTSEPSKTGSTSPSPLVVSAPRKRGPVRGPTPNAAE